MGGQIERMKRIATVAAAAVLAGGAGFAITDSLGSSGNDSAVAESGRDFRGGPPGMDGHGMPPGMDGDFHDDLAADLAEELGISEERVADALEAVLADRRP